MEFFNLTQLHHLMGYLYLHPHISGLITFAIAFIESLALIGGLVPGSVIMTGIGALMGSGTIPFTSTIIWAIVGAFVGDFLSYTIGAYYNERLRSMWPFRKHPRWLLTGETFFKKHGGKSVLIGRFFGPVRSLVPLIAGLLHLSVLRFVIADVLAAILWSLVYMLPGVAVGALSLELPPASATKFILIVLAVVAFGWIGFVAVHLAFKKSLILLNKTLNRFWYWLRTHNSTRWFTHLLVSETKVTPTAIKLSSNDPTSDRRDDAEAGPPSVRQHAGVPQRQDPEEAKSWLNLMAVNLTPSSEKKWAMLGHKQLKLAFFCLLYIVLFAWIAENAITHTHLFALNEPVFELLRSIRTQVGDDIMLSATLLGNKYTMLISGGLVFLWLCWKRYIRAAFHWLALILLSAGATDAFKVLYFSPRPNGLLHPQLTSSFPSGHTLLATALLGFLVILIQPALSKNRRTMPLQIAIFFIFMVALSRLYLGAHWLLDIVGSLLLGLACITLVTLSYRRQTSKPLSPSVCIVSVALFLIVWAVYGMYQFHKERENYTLHWPSVVVNADNSNASIPFVALSRLGKPGAILNVQWSETPLEIIQAVLTQKGWKTHPIHLDWKNRLNRLSPKKNPEQVPAWPLLYQNQAPVLIMTRSIQGHWPLHLLLWKSNVASPLWVGSLHYQIPKHGVTITGEEVKGLYGQAIQILKADLGEIPSHTYHVPETQSSNALRSLKWDGELLLVGE